VKLSFGSDLSIGSASQPRHQTTKGKGYTTEDTIRILREAERALMVAMPSPQQGLLNGKGPHVMDQDQGGSFGLSPVWRDAKPLDKSDRVECDFGTYRTLTVNLPPHLPEATTGQ
jgi:hypothetical protein